MRKKGSILVVENDLAMRSAIKAILCDGYELWFARHAEQGCEILNSTTIDTVTLEPRLPKAFGREALDMLRDTDPSARVIVVTDQPLSVWFDDSIREEVFDYLPKPFTPRELSRMVRRSMIRPEQRQVAAGLRMVV